jgi:hypothetical protein
VITSLSRRLNHSPGDHFTVAETNPLSRRPNHYRGDRSTVAVSASLTRTSPNGRRQKITPISAHADSRTITPEAG